LEHKLDFFHESARILRPDGWLVAADVLAETPPSHFLNISVDRFADLGHDGMFPQMGDFSRLMRDAGFVDVREDYEEFTWDFPDEPALIQFCHMLFRMSRATLAEVRAEVDRYLRVTTSSSGTHLHWSLVYASGRRPRDP
jgi:hypothetical protein